jgi:flagellar hook-associated protein 3 FlgL
MTMRVTNSMLTSTMLTDLNRSLERLQRSQSELASGRAIMAPSDDPAGASSAMLIRNQLRQSDQYVRAQSDAQSWLGTADSVLVNGLDLLGRVKELAVRAANTGSNDATSRSALAAEVGQIRGELIALANTKYMGRSIFNGTADGLAYDDAGVYQGDDAPVVRDIAPGVSVQVNVTGTEVFGDPTAAGGDLFAVLERMQTAIAAGDTGALATEHDRLDTARQRVGAAAGTIGARAARLDGVQARTATDEITLRETLSAIEDVDIAEALISVKARENAYTAALQAAAKVLPPSLLDYMR